MPSQTQGWGIATALVVGGFCVAAVADSDSDDDDVGLGPAPLTVAVARVTPRGLRVPGSEAMAVVSDGGTVGDGPGLHLIAVGQGAALLLRGSQHTVMIDSGPAAAAEVVLAALAEHGVRRVDLWVHTHLDADHVGGFSRILPGVDATPGTADDIEVAMLWDRGIIDAPATIAVQAYIAGAGDRRRQASPGDRWTVPGLTLVPVDTGANPGTSENALGLALCIDVGALRVLALGDLPDQPAEAAASACGPVDVLWAAHHGASAGNSAATLAAADPAVILISAGHDNSYCHPAPLVLARVHDRPVWLTGIAGGSPFGRCRGLANDWGPHHQILPGDLWLTGRTGI